MAPSPSSASASSPASVWDRASGARSRITDWIAGRRHPSQSAIHCQYEGYDEGSNVELGGWKGRRLGCGSRVSRVAETISLPEGIQDSPGGVNHRHGNQLHGCYRDGQGAAGDFQRGSAESLAEGSVGNPFPSHRLAPSLSAPQLRTPVPSANFRQIGALTPRAGVCYIAQAGEDSRPANLQHAGSGTVPRSRAHSGRQPSQQRGSAPPQFPSSHS